MQLFTNKDFKQFSPEEGQAAIDMVKAYLLNTEVYLQDDFGKNLSKDWDTISLGFKDGKERDTIIVCSGMSFIRKLLKECYLEITKRQEKYEHDQDEGCLAILYLHRIIWDKGISLKNSNSWLEQFAKMFFLPADSRQFISGGLSRHNACLEKIALMVGDDRFINCYTFRKTPLFKH